MKRASTMILMMSVFGAPAHAFTLTGSSSLLGWNHDTLVVNYDPSACPISEEKLKTAIDAAVEVWNNVPTSRLKLERGAAVSATPAQAASCSAAMFAAVPLITCDTAMSATIGANSNYIPAAALGLSCISSGSSLTYGYILLNAEAGKSAKIDQIDANTLAMVVAHELGHVLGLGHTADVDALMYFDATEKTQLRLSQDDIEGISYLYPRNEPNGGKAFACATVEAGAGGGGGIGVLAGFFALCWLMTRAARIGIKPRAV